MDDAKIVQMYFDRNEQAIPATADKYGNCPILSLVSFVLFEREIPLSNGIWTSIVAIPSCLYWMIYIVLSLTKL